MRSVGKQSFCILAALLLSVGLYGCGSDVGPPGSDGLEKVGASVTVSIEPTYLDEFTLDVDAIQDQCVSPEGKPEGPEPFTRHGADAVFTVNYLTADPGPLTIDEYEIEFYNSTPGTPPIQHVHTFQTINLTAEGEFRIPVVFIDLDRKNDYGDDMLSGMYPQGTERDHPRYDAQYAFRGQNQYGDDFTLRANVQFYIGWYDYCP